MLTDDNLATRYLFVQKVVSYWITVKIEFFKKSYHKISICIKFVLKLKLTYKISFIFLCINLDEG